MSPSSSPISIKGRKTSWRPVIDLESPVALTEGWQERYKAKLGRQKAASRPINAEAFIPCERVVGFLEISDGTVDFQSCATNTKCGSFKSGGEPGRAFGLLDKALAENRRTTQNRFQALPGYPPILRAVVV